MLTNENRNQWNHAAQIYSQGFGHASTTSPDNICYHMLPTGLGKLRILDAGCAHGGLTRYLAQNGAKVVGIDVSDKLINIAKEEEKTSPLGIEYHVHDLTEPLKMIDEEFDLVIASMVLHDVADPMSAICNVCHSICDGGQFIFSIMNPCFFRHSSDKSLQDSYFDRDRVETRTIKSKTDGKECKYRQYHRTIGDYLNTLISCQMVLTRFWEPEEAEDRGTQRMLGIKCRKDISIRE